MAVLQRIGRAHRAASLVAVIALILTSSCSSSDNGEEAEAANSLKLTEAGTISAMTINDAIPMSYVEDGEVKGMAPDLVKEIARRLDLKVTFQIAAFAGILTAVSEHQNDMGGVFMYVTPEREQEAAFSIPWLYASNTAIAKTEAGFDSLDDLAGRDVAVVQGSAQELWLPENVPTAKAKTFLTDAAAVAATQAGQVDIFMTTSTAVAAHLQTYPDLGIVASAPDEAPGAFPIALDRPELKEAVDKELMAMMEDGTWMSIYLKWAPGVPIPPAMIEQYPVLEDQL